MYKIKLIFFCVVSELLIICTIALAARFEGILFALFYNVVYGLIISISIPLLIISKGKKDFSSFGIKQLQSRQCIVLVVFVLFSVMGQLIPKITLGIPIAWDVLPVAIFPLIMTTFFEEFLFRGFIQIRIEKSFGSIAAVLVSAILFSVYHLGYPGFRTAADLLLLFAVGLGFAIAFKLSDNNLIVSYFVNLPNALITYTLKTAQFPTMTMASNFYAIFTMLLIVIGFIFLGRKYRFFAGWANQTHP